MKISEMTKICKANNGQCKDCPLNCIKDWYENETTWCLLQYREITIEKYNKAKSEHNDLLAEKIIMDYKEKEKLANI